jgi:C1A family cysteine protease
MPLSLPRRVDLRSHQGPIGDQGARSTCVAFAVSCLHECARCVENGGHEPLSEEALYWACKEVDRNTDAGTFMSSAEAALKKRGQPPSKVWPYDKNPPDLPRQPPTPPDARWHKRVLAGQKCDPGELCAALSDGRVVAIVIELTRAVYFPQMGRVRPPIRGEKTFGLHAVALVGYDLDNDHFVIRNSWGVSWGDGGYGYLPFAYVTSLGADPLAAEKAQIA